MASSPLSLTSSIILRTSGSIPETSSSDLLRILSITSRGASRIE